MISNFPDLCFLYQNQQTVICGRFQNLNAEINHKSILQNKIRLMRRISGGGTVYHDMGNLNYSFICTRHEGLNYFDYFNIILIETFGLLGLTDLRTNFNNIFCKGYKISGTAQYKSKLKILHHGTLLIDSDLNLLNDALKLNPNYISRSTRSIQSKTANISYFLKESSTSKIIPLFLSALNETIGLNEKLILNDTDNQHINEFVLIYKSDRWVYGNSPYYIFSNIKDERNHAFLKVRKGIIEHAEIKSSNNPLLEKFSLIGKYHKYDSMVDFLITRSNNCSEISHNSEEINLLFN